MTEQNIAQHDWALEVKDSNSLSVQCSNRKPVAFFSMRVDTGWRTWGWGQTYTDDWHWINRPSVRRCMSAAEHVWYLTCSWMDTAVSVSQLRATQCRGLRVGGWP